MRLNDNKLNEYKKISILKIEDILDALGIPYLIKSTSMINILCPVHNSSDFSSSSIRLYDGKWTCWSRSCNHEVGGHFINLIMWCLKQKGANNWGDIFNFIDSPTFQIIDRPTVAIVQQEDFDIKKYPSVLTPSKYYIDRGFKTGVLDKFGIGDCYNGPYAEKAVVPIKASGGKLIGFTARSIWDKCPKCNYHHSRFQLCISSNNKYANFYKKWIHSPGLRTSLSPYNIQNIHTDKVAVVEGPSCVWRLDDFNVGAVACLGKEFTMGHKTALKNIGVKKILFISDNDEAGSIFKKRFIKDNSKDFEIYLHKDCKEKDVTEMSEQTIKDSILTVWEKI